MPSISENIFSMLFRKEWTPRPSDQVNSASQLDGLLERVAAFYRDRLDIQIQASVRPSCIRLDSGLPTGVTGLASWTLQTPGNRISNVCIRLMPGDSTLCTAAVLSHEVFHIMSAGWQLKLTQKHEEGMANLAQYLFLRHETGPEAAFLATALHQDDNPIYGDGFREARQVYRREASFRRTMAAFGSPGKAGRQGER